MVTYISYPKETARQTSKAHSIPNTQTSTRISPASELQLNMPTQSTAQEPLVPVVTTKKQFDDEIPLTTFQSAIPVQAPPPEYTYHPSPVMPASSYARDVPDPSRTRHFHHNQPQSSIEELTNRKATPPPFPTNLPRRPSDEHTRKYTFNTRQIKRRRRIVVSLTALVALFMLSTIVALSVILGMSRRKSSNTQVPPQDAGNIFPFVSQDHDSIVSTITPVTSLTPLGQPLQSTPVLVSLSITTETVTHSDNIGAAKVTATPIVRPAPVSEFTGLPHVSPTAIDPDSIPLSESKLEFESELSTPASSTTLSSLASSPSVPFASPTPLYNQAQMINGTTPELQPPAPFRLRQLIN